MKRLFFLLILSNCFLVLEQCSDNPPGLEVEDFFYVRNKGADMPVSVEGKLSSGKFIIMLHGGPGGDDEVYNNGIRNFSDKLENEFVMVYFDQRGSGISMGNYTHEQLTLSQFVEDLDCVIKVLNDRYGKNIKIYLLGHSWGGALGTAFLIEKTLQPKVKGWIEVDGAHEFNNTKVTIAAFKRISDEQIQQGHSTKFWNEIKDYCDKIDTANISDLTISKLNKYGYKAEETLMKDSVIKTNYDSINALLDIEGIINYYLFSGYNPLTSTINLYFTSSGFGMFDEVKNLNLTPELHKISIPVLFLWGKYDMVLPVELGNKAYDNIGSTDKEIFVFQNSGHSAMLTETYLFSQKVIEFVKNH